MSKPTSPPLLGPPSATLNLALGFPPYRSQKPGLLRVPRLEVGEQLLPDIVAIDERVLGSASGSPEVCVRMSRPGFLAAPSGYAGHLVGNSAVGLPVGKTPIETYFTV